MRIGSDVRHFVLLKLDLRSCNCLFKLSLRCFEIFIEIELDIGWGNSHSLVHSQIMEKQMEILQAR